MLSLSRNDHAWRQFVSRQSGSVIKASEVRVKREKSPESIRSRGTACLSFLWNNPLNTAADQYSCCVSNRAVRLDSFPSQSLMNSVSAGEIKPFSESWASEGQIYMFEHTHTHTHTHTHARTKTTHPVTETWHL